jgi:hypothetical protein
MLTPLDLTLNIFPIVEQVKTLTPLSRITLNWTDGPLFSGTYMTKPEFINTPLGDALELIIKKFGKIGEARLLTLQSAEGYTAHSDPDDRIHIAIATNDHSYLIDLDSKKLWHLPVDGKVWYMNTSALHVAANYGARPRIHLNIRVPLPPFSAPGYRLSIQGGDYDWKQEIYIRTMKFLNLACKDKRITGIEKINERTLLLNLSDPTVLDPYLNELRSEGFNVELTVL